MPHSRTDIQPGPGDHTEEEGHSEHDTPEPKGQTSAGGDDRGESAAPADDAHLEKGETDADFDNWLHKYSADEETADDARNGDDSAGAVNRDPDDDDDDQHGQGDDDQAGGDDGEGSQDHSNQDGDPNDDGDDADGDDDGDGAEDDSDEGPSEDELKQWGRKPRRAIRRMKRKLDQHFAAMDNLTKLAEQANIHPKHVPTTLRLMGQAQRGNAEARATLLEHMGVSTGPQVDRERLTAAISQAEETLDLEGLKTVLQPLLDVQPEPKRQTENPDRQQLNERAGSDQPQPDDPRRGVLREMDLIEAEYGEDVGPRIIDAIKAELQATPVEDPREWLPTVRAIKRQVVRRMMRGAQPKAERPQKPNPPRRPPSTPTPVSRPGGNSSTPRDPLLGDNWFDHWSRS